MYRINFISANYYRESIEAKVRFKRNISYFLYYDVARHTLEIFNDRIANNIVTIFTNMKHNRKCSSIVHMQELFDQRIEIDS